jgi:hypothetical protein
MELMQFIFSSFWTFVGVLMLGGGALTAILEVLWRSYNRTMRMISIRKHGWPPPHCDADGDSTPPKSPSA